MSQELLVFLDGAAEFSGFLIDLPKLEIREVLDERNLWPLAKETDESPGHSEIPFCATIIKHQELKSPAYKKYQRLPPA